MKELIADRATGVYFTPDTLAEGGRIFRVNERKAPVAVYDLASVTFTTEPSNATVNDLDAALRKYVEENKTAKRLRGTRSGSRLHHLPRHRYCIFAHDRQPQ